MGHAKQLMIPFRTTGRKGDVKFAIARPVMAFKGKKLIVEDDFSGWGTLVVAIYIDGQCITPRVPWWRRLWYRIMRRAHGLPTALFAGGVLGGDLGLPVCPAHKEMSFEIEFLADGQWKADLHGEGLVE